MEFVAGVMSSLAASVLLMIASRKTVRRIRAFNGIQLLEPVRTQYTKHIATRIRANRKTFFFKGLTGYDLFCSEYIRDALMKTPTGEWKELAFLLTDRSSGAFSSELNRHYTPKRLAATQDLVVEFLAERFLSRDRPVETCTRGVFFVREDRTLVNILVLDHDAYIFFRGFTSLAGPKGQVIVRVDLTRCAILIRDLILHIKDNAVRLLRAVLSTRFEVFQVLM